MKSGNKANAKSVEKFSKHSNRCHI